MGPQHQCCGRLIGPNFTLRAQLGFNGAAASMLRKTMTGHEREAGVVIASMGPQHQCSGRLVVYLAVTGRNGTLQWGRSINAAEDLVWALTELMINTSLQWGRSINAAEDVSNRI